MFEYFPTNYIWSLGVAATLNSGGAIDEVDRACRPIRDAAAKGDAGTRDLMLAWKRVADQVADQAREAEAAGHHRTAGQKYFRSAAYVCQAERMLSSKDPERIPFYQEGLDAMQKSFDLVDPATSRVSIPFEGSRAAGVLPEGRARGRHARADDDHVERARLDQGAHVHLGLAAGAGPARHLHADGRLPRQR